VFYIDYNQYRERTGRYTMNTYGLPRGSARTPHPDPNTEQQVCQTRLRAHATSFNAGSRHELEPSGFHSGAAFLANK